MPYFVLVTPPEGSIETEACVGPFSSLQEAEACRQNIVDDGPPEGTVVSEVQEQSLTWFRSRPVPQTTIPQEDGSTLEIWTDGSQRIIPAE